MGEVKSEPSKSSFHLTVISDLGRSLTNSLKYKSLTFQVAEIDQVIVSAGLPAIDCVMAFKDAMDPARLREIIIEYVAAAVEDAEG